MHAPVLLATFAATALAGHLAVPVTRQGFRHVDRAALLKRQDDDDDGSLTLEALNNITGGGYYADFDIGTPPQRINFQLDTGSSDTWVNSANSDLCNSAMGQNYYGYCSPTFDPNDSSTFSIVDRGGFDITYLDGRNIMGSYFEDTVTIGDSRIRNQQLGLATQSVRPTGIMGLGFSANVAADSQYNTIIDNMVEQNIIETRAYSLYLNDLSTDSGNILFGAIDGQKFYGSLATLPLVSEAQSSSSNITSFNVRIQGFDVRNSDGDKPVDMPRLDSLAILDSGSTISLLPDDQVQELWDEFGVVKSSQTMTPYIDCAYRGDRGRGYVFEFRFDGKTIRVPMEEMVIDAYADVQELFVQLARTESSLEDAFEDWDSVCMFGVGSTADFGIETNQFTLLGDTFLRSAYVVYDLENEQVAIAQANLNSTDTDIVDITTGRLPSVTGVERGSDDDTSDDDDDDDGDDNAGGRASPSAMALGSVVGLVGLAMVAL